MAAPRVSFPLRIVLTVLLAACPTIARGETRAMSAAAPGQAQEPSDSTRLSEAIDLAGGYLTRVCTESGQFIYVVNLKPSVRTRPIYNIVRHAGAIYALAAQERRNPNKATRDALLRAAEFMKAKTIAPAPADSDFLAVWSRPEINRRPKAPVVKLGGTGLGLVALLSVEQVRPGTTPPDTLQRLGRFLVYMQKEDGSFYSKYVPSKGGRYDKWISLYYPGEAMLGLVMLYEYEKDPDPQWLDATVRGMTCLARQRRGRKRVEADHWALLATARLLPILERSGKPFPRKAILDHAAQICESILAERPDRSRTSVTRGCFSSDGRTCPTATRLEGLLAALTFLPAEHAELRRRIGPCVKEGIDFLLRSQIRDGEHRGGIPRAIRRLPPNHPRFNWIFNRRATEIRIDYVQHALSAMIAFEASELPRASANATRRH